MARDPLDALLRLRRLAQEEATRDLAAALAASDATTAALERVELSIAAETAAASSIEADDVAVEAFGRWLQLVKVAHAAAAAASGRAEAETVRARAVLGAARAAVRAVEGEIERQAAAARASALKREQAATDENARRKR